MFSPLQSAVLALEIALALAGLCLFVWVLVSPAGRAARMRLPVLPAWPISRNDFLFFLWLVITLGFFGQMLLQSTSGEWLRAQPDGKTLEPMVYGSVFHLGAILAWIILRTRERRQRPPGEETIVHTTRAPVRRVAGGAVLALISVIPLAGGAGMLSEYLLELTGLPAERQELIDMFLQVGSPALLYAMIAFALVVAPVSEELVFRAGLFRYLRTRLPRWAAFATSAGLFALLHANLASLLPLFVVGVVFSVAYERTGSIVTSMLAHALFNLNTLLLVLSGIGQ